MGVLEPGAEAAGQNLVLKVVDVVADPEAKHHQHRPLLRPRDFLGGAQVVPVRCHRVLPWAD